MYMKDVNNDPEVVRSKDSERKTLLKVMACLKSWICCCSVGVKALR
jgi:hypothetical protein